MRCRVRGQGIRRFASADSGAADVVGNILTLGITVSLATGFSVFLLAMPGPDPEEPARVEAFILANRPDRVVLEHRGGSAIPVRAMGLLVDVDGASALYDVGARLAAADPAFAVVSAQGLAKTATDRFETGDQLQYTNASIRGREVTIGMKEGDIARLFFNSRVLETDTTAPVLVSARTLAATRIQLNFSERLFEVSPTDFSVSNGSISTISLLGNGSAAEIVTSPYGPNATPTVSTAGSPAGTRDLANVLLAGGTSVVAADGVAPTITVAPGATAGTSTASVSWETNETSDSVVEFGATPALGRTTSVASLVTAHTVGLSGLSGGTLYYYRVTSADAAGNRVVSPAGTFTTQSTTANPNPSFTTAIVNIAYTSVQARNVNTAIGLNIINPTGTAMQIDRVRFSALPTLGAAGSEKFFRDAMSTSAGSDPEFACVWTGNNSDTVTCDPAGTFTLPANGMKQVVLNFRTSNLNGDAYTIVTGEVVVTSPVAQTLSAEVNVRHQANGVHMDVMALSGPGGSFAAGHPAAAGGSPIDLNYRWTATANNARIRTRFIVPAGWSDLSVPAQASLASMAVNVRQPTASSFGYVDVGQDLSGGTRDLLFRVTPPAGTNVLVMQVDHDGTKDGSADRSFQSLYWFGVSIS